MALPDFPTAINNLAQRGTFSRKPGNPNRSSEYDSGPDRVRQRYSNAPDVFAFQILLDGTEKLVLDGFYKYITRYGSLWMKMPVVIGNEYKTVECRFVKDSISFADAGFDRFMATMNLNVRNAPISDAASGILYQQYGAFKGPTGAIIGGPIQRIALPNSIISTNAMGDSITRGQNASPDANMWFLKFATAKSAGTIINSGSSGTVLQNSPDITGTPRSNNGRDRYTTVFSGAGRVEYAIIAYGYNDARYTATPSTFNVTQYTQDYKEILSGLISIGYLNSQIIIVTPYWISDAGLATGSSGFTGQTRSGFEAYVQAAKNVADEYKVYMADTYTAMRDGGGLSLISGDDIHPNNLGHDVIYQAVMAATRLP